MAVVVHSASVQDRDGIEPLLERAKGRFPRLRLIWADAAYEAAVGWVKSFGGWVLQLVRKPPGQRGFRVLPRAGRWNGPSAGWCDTDVWPGTTSG